MEEKINGAIAPTKDLFGNVFEKGQEIRLKRGKYIWDDPRIERFFFFCSYLDEKTAVIKFREEITPGEPQFFRRVVDVADISA